MAGACSCRTGLNPLKSRWQGHVAARVVALEACGEFGGFEAGQTAGACRWLGHVADRGVQGHVAVRVVALEACGECEGLRPGKRCSCKSCCLAETGLNPVKSRWQGHVPVRVVALEACGEFGGFEAEQTEACGSIWGVWGV